MCTVNMPGMQQCRLMIMSVYSRFARIGLKPVCACVFGQVYSKYYYNAMWPVNSFMKAVMRNTRSVLYVHLIQFNFIYIAPNQKSRWPKVLYVVR